MTGDITSKFIYVFSKEDKDKMIGLGYVLLEEHPEKNLYIFKTDPMRSFSIQEIKAVYSSILTF